MILDHYPGIKSIKDTGSLWQSPWKKKIARIDGGLLTLDEIEHDILRPQFRDPRVHFAVNYASKGWIFKWFAEDFDDDPIGFFRKYADGNLQTELQARSQDLRVKFLEYDWSLNGA